MARGLRVDDLPHLVRPGMERAALERAVSQNFEAVQGGLQVLRDALQTVLDQPSEDLEADFAAPEGITTTFSRRKQKRRVSYHVAVRCTLPEDDEKQDRLLVQMAYVDSAGTTYKELDSDGDPVIHRALVDVPPDTDDVGKVKAVFKNLEKPRYWYVKFRMRWGSKDGWGEFSAWTTPELPKNEVTQTASGTVTITEHKHPQPGVHIWKWDDDDAEDVNVDSYHVYVERKEDDGTYTVVDEGYTRSRKWRYEVPTADRGTRHRIKVYVVDEDGNDASVTTSADQEDGAPLLKEDVEPLLLGSIDFGDANLAPDGTITMPEVPAAGSYETPALRQVTSREAWTTSSKVLNWPSTTKANSLLVLIVVTAVNSGVAPTVTLPTGYTLIRTLSAPDFKTRMNFYYKEAAAPQSSVTITLSSAPTSYGAHVIGLEYEGITLSGALDLYTSDSDYNTVADPSTDVSATTAQTDELMVGALVCWDDTISDISPDFTLEKTTSYYPKTYVAHKLLTATGTEELAGTSDSPIQAGWVGILAAFKAKSQSTQTIDTPDADKVGVFAKSQNSVTRLAYKDDGGQEHILTGQHLGCRAYLTGSNQTIASGNTSGIGMTAESYDTLGMHDNTTNTDRFTVPTGYGGYYRFHAGADIDIAASHNNRVRIQLRLNGTTIVRTTTTPIHLATGGHALIPATVTLLLSAGDYIEFRVETVDEAVDIQAGSHLTFMEAEYLGNA